MTLPLIYALSVASKDEKSKIINIIKNESQKTQKVQYVIDFVKKSNGIEYTTSIMNQYLKEAFQILDSLEKNYYTESLKDLIHFTIDRNK